MARSDTMDLTTGKPLWQIFLFSLPLVAGTLFQQLYAFVDTIMVGRFMSNHALGATALVYCSILVAYFLRKRITSQA